MAGATARASHDHVHVRLHAASRWLVHRADAAQQSRHLFSRIAGAFQQFRRPLLQPDS